jgi:hypothetical protein
MSGLVLGGKRCERRWEAVRDRASASSAERRPAHNLAGEPPAEPGAVESVESRSRLPIFFEGPLQADDLGSHFLEAWVEAQCAAEGFKRGDGVVLQHVALSHSRRRGEVIWIDFKCLVAVANRGIVLAQVIVGRAALAPGFGDPGRAVDELGRQSSGFRVLSLVVEVGDFAKHFLLLATADAAPQFADAGFGDGSHAAIAVDERPAEHGIGRIIAHQAQGQHGSPAGDVVAHRHEPLQRRICITTRHALDEHGAIVIR